MLILVDENTIYSYKKQTMTNYNWSDFKVLIVEDNELNFMLLEPTKININYAKNSIEFFNAIKTNVFDIILMDINLDEKLTGIDLIKYLKENEINTPVVIQSAYPQYEYKNVEFSKFINKPYTPKQVLDTINLILNKNDK